MDKLIIPDGYQEITPYLIIPGAIKFLNFMKEVFGAKEKGKMTMRDEYVVQHGELCVGKSVVMFADSTENNPPQTSVMFVYVTDCDKVYEAALTLGAKSISSPDNLSYGRSAGIKDPFGNMWWITSLD